MSRQAVLQFLGDISLNGEFADPRHHPEFASGLEAVRRELGPCDLRVGNLESQLVGDDGLKPLSTGRTWTTRQAADVAAGVGLDVALLANNHLFDCKAAGLQNTLRFLNEHGIHWVGAGFSDVEAQRPLVLDRAGMRLGLLNYVGPETHPLILADATARVNMLEPTRMLAEVRELGDVVDAVIVNLHWGDECVRYPSPAERQLARRAIEAGAALVVGHHAHRLQGYEQWQRGAILYSLGNFLFGRVDGRPWPAVSLRTAVANCVVRPREVESVRLFPLVQEGVRIVADGSPARRREQELLNRPLAWGERRYRLLRLAEVLYQWGPGALWRFVVRSGGLRKAARRLRWQHVRAAAGVLAREVSSRSVGGAAVLRKRPPSRAGRK